VETTPKIIAHLGMPYLSRDLFVSRSMWYKKMQFFQNTSGFQGAGRLSIKAVGLSRLGLLMEVGIVFKIAIL